MRISRFNVQFDSTMMFLRSMLRRDLSFYVFSHPRCRGLIFFIGTLTYRCRGFDRCPTFSRRLLGCFNVSHLRFRRGVSRSIIFTRHLRKVQATPIRRSSIAFVRSSFFATRFLDTKAKVRVIRFRGLVIIRKRVQVAVILASVSIPFFRRRFLAR